MPSASSVSTVSSGAGNLRYEKRRCVGSSDNLVASWASRVGCHSHGKFARDNTNTRAENWSDHCK